MSYLYNKPLIPNSPNRKALGEPENPYNTSFIEELLQDESGWRKSEDIVRLTLKMLSDLVKMQGQTLFELETQITTKATKSELNNGLALKANTTDVSKAIGDLHAEIDQRLGYPGQAGQKNMQYSDTIGYSRANDDERLFEKSMGEIKNELDSIAMRFQDRINVLEQKLSEFIYKRESESLESKNRFVAFNEEFTALLEGKANKQSVAEAMQKKANKSEIDALAQEKADKNVVSDIELAVEKIINTLDDKVDKNDMTLVLTKLGQKAENKDLESIFEGVMQQKSDFQEMRASIEDMKDVVSSELEKMRQTITNEIVSKADLGEIDRIVQILSRKPDIEQVNMSLIKLREDVSREVNTIRESLEAEQSKNERKSATQSETLSIEMDGLKADIAELQQKLESPPRAMLNYVNGAIEDLQKYIDTQVQRLEEAQEEMKQENEAHSRRKINEGELLELKVKLLERLESKTDLAEVQGVLNSFGADFAKKTYEMKEEFKNQLRTLEAEIYSALNKKANVLDVEAALENKVDMSFVSSLRREKSSASVGQSDSFNNKIDTLQANINAKLNEKINMKDFQHAMGSIKKMIDETRRDVLLKANIEDICKLLDGKLGVEEFGLAIKEIKREINSKKPSEDLARALEDQALINESLCTENILGRWAWKSSKSTSELTTDGFVPWEIQIANTLPENFVWEKNSRYIIVVTPGLYEVTYGFFTSSKALVTLYVNDNAVLTTAKNEEDKEKTKMSKYARYSGYGDGTKKSVSNIDYLIIPPRAKISISYEGDKQVEAFFNIKRL